MRGMGIVAWKQGHSEKTDEAKYFFVFSEMLDIVEYELLHLLLLLLFFFFLVILFCNDVFLLSILGQRTSGERWVKKKVNELQAY